MVHENPKTQHYVDVTLTINLKSIKAFFVVFTPKQEES